MLSSIKFNEDTFSLSEVFNGYRQTDRRTDGQTERQTDGHNDFNRHSEGTQTQAQTPETKVQNKHSLQNFPGSFLNSWAS